MAEPDRITGTDDSALDALLSTLTEPGEGPAFRARVLARLDESADGARPSRPWRWAVAGVLVAAALVAATFTAWRPQRTVNDGMERVAVEVPAALPGGGSSVFADSSPGATSDTGAPVAAKASAQMVASAVRRTSAAVREPPMVAARDAFPDDQPLPYGMERIRLEPVSIQPFALREVREDPMMAALAPPEPVRVDPIDIAEIAPRR